MARRAPFPMEPPHLTPRHYPFCCLEPGSPPAVLRGCFVFCCGTADERRAWLDGRDTMRLTDSGKVS